MMVVVHDVFNNTQIIAGCYNRIIVGCHTRIIVVDVAIGIIDGIDSATSSSPSTFSQNVSLSGCSKGPIGPVPRGLVMEVVVLQVENVQLPS
jgi:hypothetical protein